MPHLTGDKINSVARVGVTVGATSLESALLPVGTYLITTDADCYIKHGPTGMPDVSPTDFSAYLPAGGATILTVDATAESKYVSVIRRGSSAGTLMLQPITAARPPE